MNSLNQSLERTSPTPQAGYEGGRAAVLMKEVATRQMAAILLTRYEEGFS